MEELAIDGGPRTIEEPLPREWPGVHWVDENEKELVASVLETDPARGFNTCVADEFKDAIRERFGCTHVVLTNSGTSALICALGSLGIGPGMEVLVPGFMWIATVGAVVRRHAIPVLVEVDESFNMDPEDIENRITPRTRAIIPVHMAGVACDMGPVMDIARRHHLLVLEDCAQCAGGTYKGRHVGTIGDMGAFSTQRNKHFTTNSGGFVISNNEDLAEGAVYAIDQGMPRRNGVVTYVPEKGVGWGESRGMHMLTAAMGLAQIRKLPRILAAMRESKKSIKQRIAQIRGIGLRRIPAPDGDCGSFLITVYPDADTARRFGEALKAEGVPQWTYRVSEYGMHIYHNMVNLVRKIGLDRENRCPWQCELNRHSSHSYGRGALPRSDALFDRSLIMAVPSRLTENQCHRIARAYEKVAAHVLSPMEKRSEVVTEFP